MPRPWLSELYQNSSFSRTKGGSAGAAAGAAWLIGFPECAVPENDRRGKGLEEAECGRPDVQMLADVFHMYKGSGHHFGFEHFGAGRLGLVHVNDYPATPGRAEIGDADRVYPGDGLAPWQEIVAMLEGIGYEGMLSLELFNESFWARGPAAIAREGLEKLKRCLEG